MVAHSGLEDPTIDPCGGCGEKDPNKRCIGCLHEFHPKKDERVPFMWGAVNIKTNRPYDVIRMSKEGVELFLWSHMTKEMAEKYKVVPYYL